MGAIRRIQLEAQGDPHEPPIWSFAGDAGPVSGAAFRYGRALVVAPHDVLTIHNRSHEPLDLALAGRPLRETLSSARTITRWPSRRPKSRSSH